MSSKRPASKRTHAEMEAKPEPEPEPEPGAASLDQLAVGTDAAVHAAIAATEGMMAALREKGMAVVTVDARRAGELRDALEAADGFFTHAYSVKKGAIAQEPTAGTIQDGRRTPRRGYVGIVRRVQGRETELIKQALDGSCVGGPGRWSKVDIGGEWMRVVNCRKTTFEEYTPHRYQIWVKTLTGKTITFDVRWLDTVLSLKEKIQDKEGVRPEDQRIIFAGRQLQDKWLLGNCDVQKDSTLQFLMRLCGD